MSQTPGDKKNPPTRLARGLESLLAQNAKSLEESASNPDAIHDGADGDSIMGDSLAFEAPHPALPGATQKTTPPAGKIATDKVKSEPPQLETRIAANAADSKSATKNVSDHTERELQLALRSAELSQQHAREAGMELQHARQQNRWLMALLAVVIFLFVFGAWWSGWVIGQRQGMIAEHAMDPAVTGNPAADSSVTTPESWEVERAKLIAELRAKNSELSDMRKAQEAANRTIDDLNEKIHHATPAAQPTREKPRTER